jgi:hypothetical protein
VARPEAIIEKVRDAIDLPLVEAERPLPNATPAPDRAALA